MGGWVGGWDGPSADGWTPGGVRWGGKSEWVGGWVGYVGGGTYRLQMDERQGGLGGVGRAPISSFL